MVLHSPLIILYAKCKLELMEHFTESLIKA